MNDAQIITVGGKLLALVLSAVGAVFFWLFRGLYNTQKTQAEQLSKVKARIVAVESRIDHFPTAEAVHELSTAVSQLTAHFSGESRVFDAKLEGVGSQISRLERTTDRIENYLKNGDGR